jgi:hypothetical protein
MLLYIRKEVKNLDNILYEKQVTCLYCNLPFKTTKVKQSKLIVKHKDHDFCTHYEGEINPYYYDVNVCPHCGYAFLGNSPELRNSEKEILRKNYIEHLNKINLCGPRNMEDAITSYKLALICSTLLKEQYLMTASLCLRLSWLYRFQNNPQEEERFLANALNAYLSVYEFEDLNHLAMGKATLFYLLAELNGRLKKYEETRKWFSKLFAEKNAEPKVVKMARERWYDYKEQIKEIGI